MVRNGQKTTDADEATAPEEPNPFDGLADPPRPVSVRLQLHLLLSSVLVVASVVVGVIGMLLPGELVSPMPLNPFLRPEWKQVQGEFDRVERKFVRVRGAQNGRRRTNELRYLYRYHFRLAGGQAFSGQSYLTTPSRRSGRKPRS